jgi:anti-anti-sigma factor
MTTPGTIVMVFSGEYDLTSKQQLREAFAFVADAERAVLDFNGVTYLDSTALSELTLLHKSRSAAGLGAATIVTSNGNVLRLFEIVDMRQFFNFTGTMPEIAAAGDGVRIHDASSFGANGSAGTNGSAAGTQATPYRSDRSTPARAGSARLDTSWESARTDADFA